MNFGNLFDTSVDGLTKEQLERASQVFIHEGTSFAIVSTILYMSRLSADYLRLRHDFILYGENGKTK